MAKVRMATRDVRVDAPRSDETEVRLGGRCLRTPGACCGRPTNDYRRERDVESEREEERERDELLPPERFRDPPLLRVRLELLERFFFAPPSCLLTVAQARFAAVFELTPRFL